MKRNAFDHPKFRRLARLLELPAPWGPLGIMEALSHFTAKHAIQGDIGKWSDEEIADGIGWDGDPAKLIEALVEARLFDRDPVHRLVVHDWKDHADDSVRKTLKRNGLDFISAEHAPQESGHVPDTSGKVETCCACQSQSQSQSQDSLSAEADNPPDAVSQAEQNLIAKWNSCDGVAANRGDTLTPKRRRLLRTRLKSPDWLPDAHAALAKFPLRCQLDEAGNVRTDAWRPDLEWFLNPDSVTKILEGKYDFTKANGNGHVPRNSPARIRE